MRISDWSSDVCSSDLAVGEVNVVTKMKEVDAVIGGEGNGGVIYPEVHYGRDALIGIALFLSHLAKSGKRIFELSASYPPYYLSTTKITLVRKSVVLGKRMSERVDIGGRRIIKN